MKRQVWHHEGSVIATGVDTLEQLADLIVEDGGYSVRACLGILMHDDDTDIEPREVLDILRTRRLEGFILPIGHYRMEGWDASFMYDCALDAKPGRGRVKVVLVNSEAASELSRDSGNG